MATGAPGTNGVWQYGEDDSEATFSALLNKAAATTDTQIGADRTRLTALEAKPTAGLVPIVPTSITAVTGSASVNSLGAVTFTGCSSIQLNGVFTSAYKNYKYVLNVSGVSTAATVQFKFRKAGAPVASGYYGGWTRINEAGTTNSSGQSNTAWIFVVDGHPSVKACNAEGTIFDPLNTGVETTMIARFIGFVAGGLYNGYTGATNNGAPGSTGFQLDYSSGTFTGTLQVFGYND